MPAFGLVALLACASAPSDGMPTVDPADRTVLAPPAWPPPYERRWFALTEEDTGAVEIRGTWLSIALTSTEAGVSRWSSWQRPHAVPGSPGPEDLSELDFSWEEHGHGSIPSLRSAGNGRADRFVRAAALDIEHVVRPPRPEAPVAVGDSWSTSWPVSLTFWLPASGDSAHLVVWGSVTATQTFQGWSTVGGERVAIVDVAEHLDGGVLADLGAESRQGALVADRQARVAVDPGTWWAVQAAGRLSIRAPEAGVLAGDRAEADFVLEARSEPP